MLSSKRVVLPLVGSFFLPGKAKETIEEIEDQELAQIAWAEYYFFSAKAKECVEIVENTQIMKMLYYAYRQTCSIHFLI